MLTYVLQKQLSAKNRTERFRFRTVLVLFPFFPESLRKQTAWSKSKSYIVRSLYYTDQTFLLLCTLNHCFRLISKYSPHYFEKITVATVILKYASRTRFYFYILPTVQSRIPLTYLERFIGTRNVHLPFVCFSDVTGTFPILVLISYDYCWRDPFWWPTGDLTLILIQENQLELFSHDTPKVMS